MAYTPKLMYPSAQPGTSDGLLYTAPAGGAIIKELIVVNTSAAAATLTLNLVPSAGSSAAGNQILAGVSISAKTTVVYSLSTVMAASSMIRGLQGTATTITLTISGVEIS